jgi:hypothetical protein
MNPVAYSHLILNIGGTEWHILSRIADAGLDYTQRANKLAHHIALESHELPTAGPAAVFSQTHLFLQHWNRTPMTITTSRTLPNLESSPCVCTYWKEITNDAGWGGILAETAKDGRSATLLVSPTMNPLTLLGESLSLLPPELRWQVTWTTYYTRFPSGISCQWKCLIADSSAPPPLSASSDMLIIDLTQPMRKPVPTALVKLAKIGFLPQKNPTTVQAPVAKNAVENSPANVGTGAFQPKLIQETLFRPVTEKRQDREKKTVPTENTSSQPKSPRKKNDGKAETSIESSAYPNEQNHTRGLLMLMGLGVLFLSVPILVIGILLSYRGEKTPSKNKHIHVPQQRQTLSQQETETSPPDASPSTMPQQTPPEQTAQ